MESDARTTGAVNSPLKPYKVKEFAELADVSLNAVYMAISRGELPAVRIGGAIRMPREACDRILRGEVAV